MCIAIVSPKGKSVPEEHLKESFRCNSDGAGFAWSDGSQLFIKKGFFTYESFLESYNETFPDPTDVNQLIHFRISTGGKVDAKNCHPWALPNNCALIHNGILSHSSTPKISDTGMFCKQVLSPLLMTVEGAEKTEWFRYFFEDYLGSGNAVAIMNRFGEYTIFNEKGRSRVGGWEGGNWYSNSSYQPFRSSVYSGGGSCSAGRGNVATHTSVSTSQPSKSDLIGALVVLGYDGDSLGSFPYDTLHECFVAEYTQLGKELGSEDMFFRTDTTPRVESIKYSPEDSFVADGRSLTSYVITTKNKTQSTPEARSTIFRTYSVGDTRVVTSVDPQFLTSVSLNGAEEFFDSDSHTYYPVALMDLGFENEVASCEDKNLLVREEAYRVICRDIVGDRLQPWEDLVKDVSSAEEDADWEDEENKEAEVKPEPMPGELEAQSNSDLVSGRWAGTTSSFTVPRSNVIGLKFLAVSGEAQEGVECDLILSPSAGSDSKNNRRFSDAVIPATTFRDLATEVTGGDVEYDKFLDALNNLSL